MYNYLFFVRGKRVRKGKGKKIKEERRRKGTVNVRRGEAMNGKEEEMRGKRRRKRRRRNWRKS
jgi:hypothetical protein